MVANEDLLKKLGIPLKAAVTASAHALPFPMESPATKAATQVMGMSLDTPTAARVGADTPVAKNLGTGMNATSDKVLTAIGVLSPVAGAGHSADAGLMGGSSQVVSALAHSIAGAEGGRHAALDAAAGKDDNRRAGEEELSTADEAAIAALQELGACGRWGKDGGRGGGSRAVDSPSGGSGAGGSSINSRHGAARGRQVTRSCPGCWQRISIACKFCTLCGYTFRRSTAQNNQSQPSTPRDALLSPSRGADVPAAAAAAAALSAGLGGTADGGLVDGAKTLGALLKKGKAAAGAGEVLSAAGVLLAPGDRSKMLTPVKCEAGAAAADTPSPAKHQNQSPECALAAIAAARAAGSEVGGEQSVSTPTARQTVTRVTANSLELHKIKEQARRAREKQLLARLQSLLFDGRESPPSASEVTYNLVLTCAVESLRERFSRRGHDLSHLNIDEAIAPEPAMTPREPGTSSHTNAEMEKHKIKEQQRRAKKRQLLSTLQSMVLGEGETNGKATGITGNYILELVVVQLEKERLEMAVPASSAAVAVKSEEAAA